MSVLTTSAILLRSYPYSESSRIFRFLTPDLGLIGVMAKGARRGESKGRGGMDLLDEGELTFYFREGRDLQTFKSFSPTHSRRKLGSDVMRFAGASLLAELVLRHSGEEEADALFTALKTGLARIELDPAVDPIPRILSEGWQIITVLGYEPVLDACVRCGQSLDAREGMESQEALDEEAADAMACFDFDSGGIRCSRCGRPGEGPRIGPVARTHLRDLLAGDPPDELPGAPAHLRLLGDFVTYHILEGRPLNTLRFLSDLAAP